MAGRRSNPSTIVAMIMVFCLVLTINFVQTAAHSLKFVPYEEETAATNSVDSGKEAWGYVTVRPDAHMFWWVYKTTNEAGVSNSPLVLWLQGGPGGSGTGFGNFGEIGPLDVNQKPRNTTWLQKASLLFIDNPVGTGFSYVDKDSAFTTDVQMIAQDLLTTFTAFLSQDQKWQTVPFYIFSESYGGKMTAAFSQVLWKAIQSKKVKCNFQGLAMGDSWISPIDSVYSWGPYLYVNSLVDREQLSALNDSANKIAEAAAMGEWVKSTNLWSALENQVESVTSGVNFYNIQQWGSSEAVYAYRADGSTPAERSYQRHVGVYLGDALSSLMNGPIRNKLGIIPPKVTWGGQAGDVFTYQQGDFMKNVTDIVEDLIQNTKLKVVVYSGQLDLIVDNLGTEAWVYRLSNSAEFRKAKKEPLIGVNSIPQGFSKIAGNFQYYWILDAGHMVPADNGPAALMMLEKIIGN